MKLEVPYSPEFVRRRLARRGRHHSCRRNRALHDGFGCNLSGGFHHAYPNHGEGFCAIHDVAVAIRRLTADKAIRKRWSSTPTCITATAPPQFLAATTAVFTISIHQENNYPPHKPPSNLDLNMWDRADDDGISRRTDSRGAKIA